MTASIHLSLRASTMRDLRSPPAAHLIHFIRYVRTASLLLALVGAQEALQAASMTPSVATSASGPLSMHELDAQVRALEAQQDQLLREVRDQVRSLPPGSPQQVRAAGQLAEIEHAIAQEQATYYLRPDAPLASARTYYDEVGKALQKSGQDEVRDRGGPGIHGSVRLRVVMDRTGKVVNTHVMNSDAPALAAFALRVVARANLPPAPADLDAKFQFTKAERTMSFGQQEQQPSAGSSK